MENNIFHDIGYEVTHLYVYDYTLTLLGTECEIILLVIIVAMEF